MNPVRAFFPCLLLIALGLASGPIAEAAPIGGGAGPADELVLDAPPSIDGPGRGGAARRGERRSRPVRVNLDALSRREEGPGVPLRLRLFPDVILEAREGRTEMHGPGRRSWFGRIEGRERSQAVLAVVDGFLAGNIRVDDKLYQIRSAPDGEQTVTEIDLAVFPDELPPVAADLAGPTAPISDPTAAADTGATVDVLVVYTHDAAVEADTAAPAGAIQAEIQLAVDEMNQTFLNSGILPRMRLVHAAEVAYTETGNLSTDLQRLWKVGDGFLDEVHALRDAHGADLVSLWVKNGGPDCGLSNQLAGDTTTFAPMAFSTVVRSCAASNLSFAHELGHLMGVQHDWYAYQNVDFLPAPPAYLYGHGFTNALIGTVDVNARWRTIMAYNNECLFNGFNCVRVPYWSNPDVSYSLSPTGILDPMGTPWDSLFNPADNRRCLNTTAFSVANFRQAAVSIGVAIDPVPAPTSSSSQPLTGTMTSGATVTLTVDTGATPGVVTYPTATTWACTISGLVAGENVVTVTASDGSGNTASATATLERYARVEIPLSVGWNLISFPIARCWHVGSPPGGSFLPGTEFVPVASVGEAFAGIAGRYDLIRSFDGQGFHDYDPALPAYLNDLTYVAGGHGYWIRMSEAAVLTLEGRAVAPSASLGLRAGWNLAGYWAGDVRYLGSLPTVSFPPGVTYTQVPGVAEIFPGPAPSLEAVWSHDANGDHTYEAGNSSPSPLTYGGPGYGYWLKTSVPAALQY